MAAMLTLSADHLAAYRAETYQLRPDLRVTTRAGHRLRQWARLGTFLAGQGRAAAQPVGRGGGEWPVPNEHDDPGHVTWGWKDELLGVRRWYYAKVLRKKATFIALDAGPTFYALSENYGEPQQDYLLHIREDGLPRGGHSSCL